MSLLRSLRAYIGLGPDEEYEDRYLYDLDLRNAEIDLTDDDAFEDDDELESISAHLVADDLEGQPVRNKAAQKLVPDSDSTEDDNTGPLEILPDGPTGGGKQSAGNAARSKKGRSEKQSTKQSGMNGAADATEGVVRSLDRHRGRPRTITPTSFSDSKVLADEFNRGVPIVLDLQGQSRELSRRLIDFASGVCYVLDGSMEKVSPHVFLLTPRSAKVSKQDRRLIEEGGYDR